jgi:hypothetical protein
VIARLALVLSLILLAAWSIQIARPVWINGHGNGNGNGNIGSGNGNGNSGNDNGNDNRGNDNGNRNPGDGYGNGNNGSGNGNGGDRALEPRAIRFADARHGLATPIPIFAARETLRPVKESEA